MSVVATAGAAAWVVPEIVTAKPAAGATLSGTPGIPTTSASTTGSAPKTPASTSPGALAFTGDDLRREAEIGAALVAGGWTMQRWASRRANPMTEAHGAGSPADQT